MPVAFPLILLMVEILHQLIGSPAMSIPLSTRFYTPQVVIRISSINSIVLIWNFPPLLQPLKPGIQEQTISLKKLSLVPAAGDCGELWAKRRRASSKTATGLLY